MTRVINLNADMGEGFGALRFVGQVRRLFLICESGEALHVIDFGGPDPRARHDALARVLGAARAEDAVTLWHLLGTSASDDRDAVFDGLARIVPPPVVVTREGIRAGDRPMRDAWWNALDLGDAEWWRAWKRRWP